MNRTIASAQEELADLATSLNPEAYRVYNAEVTKAISEANATAEKYVTDTVASFSSLRDELLEQACGLRDQYDDLIREGELGTVNAKEFHERFNRLEADKRRLNMRSERLMQDADLVAQVEGDPVGWVDERFYGNYPDLQPGFSF